MFIGAIPYGLAFILLLSPLPSLDAVGLATWFGAFYIIFFLFNTFTNIPYDALAPELTDNEGDRQKLFFVCTMFDGLVRLRTLCIFSLSGYISLSPPPLLFLFLYLFISHVPVLVRCDVLLGFHVPTASPFSHAP